MTSLRSRFGPFWLVLAALLISVAFVAGCGGDDDPVDAAADAAGDAADAAGDAADGAADAIGGDFDGTTLKVAIVANPQMQDIIDLTPELYTSESGVTIEYTVLEEQQLREVTTREVSAGGDQFDVVMIGLYEAPQFGQAGWLADMTSYADNDASWDKADVFPALIDGLSFEGKQYAAPFYAESSFLTYREDILEEAGITMPERPTWDEVADIARQVNTDEVAGICLRGKPGWGDLGASLTTVLNTFGATWWAANDDGTIGESKVDQPEFAEALNFYVDLLNDAGEPDAANSSFGECATLYKEGGVAMWYDATSAASVLEATDSDVAGKNGFTFAPVKETDTSGWLWAWSLAIAETSEQKDAAWDFISWATGPEYIAAAGELVDGGWANIPPGTRESTYAIEDYRAVAPFADPTLASMAEAPVNNPGLEPRPGLPGVQFVGVPEFQDVGNRCTAEFSAAIAGTTSTEDALAACHEIASAVSN